MGKPGTIWRRPVPDLVTTFRSHSAGGGGRGRYRVVGWLMVYVFVHGELLAAHDATCLLYGPS